MTSMHERLESAIENGVAARHTYYKAIDLPDEQVLGAAASEDTIVRLEKLIERRLPSSYRAFLQMHNGWQMIEGDVRLLSVEAQLGGRDRERVVEWQSRMRVTGDLQAARSLVIGVSDVTETRYLLDPELEGDDGEWRLIQHHNGAEAELESFVMWLEESVVEFNELARAAKD
jgi:hypothetical protein